MRCEARARARLKFGERSLLRVCVPLKHSVGLRKLVVGHVVLGIYADRPFSNKDPLHEGPSAYLAFDRDRRAPVRMRDESFTACSNSLRAASEAPPCVPSPRIHTRAFAFVVLQGRSSSNARRASMRGAGTRPFARQQHSTDPETDAGTHRRGREHLPAFCVARHRTAPDSRSLRPLPDVAQQRVPAPLPPASSLEQRRALRTAGQSDTTPRDCPDSDGEQAERDVNRLAIPAKCGVDALADGESRHPAAARDWRLRRKTR